MKKKSLIIFVSLIFLFAVVLSACGENSPNDGTTETPGNGGNEVPDIDNPGDDSTDVEKPIENDDILIKATTNGLNIRSGAGNGYRSVGTIDKNDMVAYLGEDGDWYKTWYKDKTAYVSKRLTEKVKFGKGNEDIEKVIGLGKKLLGIPYELGAQRLHWGNGNLNSNFNGKTYDCSSLMQYIFFYGAKVNLDTTSRSQSLQGTKIAKSELIRGDVIFFTNASRVNNSGLDKIGHVGMYLGNNYILHTASDYAVIEEISSTRWGYYINASRFA